jgi:hypothetical protein
MVVIAAQTGIQSVIPCALQHEMLLRRHGITISGNQHHPIPDPRSNTPRCNASGMTEKLTDTKVVIPDLIRDPDSKKLHPAMDAGSSPA